MWKSSSLLMLSSGDCRPRRLNSRVPQLVLCNRPSMRWLSVQQNASYIRHRGCILYFKTIISAKGLQMFPVSEFA